VNAASVGSLAWLITGGSLIGYTAFVYLLEHVPVAKVSSYAYVNPVVAVLLGIFLLHERPEGAEFAGMAPSCGRLPAHHAQVKAKGAPRAGDPHPGEELNRPWRNNLRTEAVSQPCL